MRASGRLLVGMFVTILVTALIVVHIAESEAQVNYDNQLSSCEAGNPVREAVLLAINTAAVNATAGRQQYAIAAKKIIVAPYVSDTTGARNCDKAVKHP